DTATPATFHQLQSYQLSTRLPHAAFLLLFSSHAHPRDLHSFPTRRSSDLLIRLAETPTGISTLLNRHTLPLSDAGIEILHIRKRSEEHTSELQSLAYLVCRLLLEKKKKKEKNNELQVDDAPRQAKIPSIAD